jgi:D-alanyl-D-alanine dipeptidase
VQNDLAGHGLGLKVFDCYRPARAVSDFDRWARNASDVARKRDYYPDIEKRDLFRLGYIGKNSSHTRGSTVDLTLIDRATGHERHMGTMFDFMGERSSFGHRDIGADARENRDLLRAAMERRGFKAYAKEWWHYTLRDEPFPKTYFDFPVR